MTRILIVEDEESYREPLVYQLTREGYDVSAAATGEEGLELFTKGGIDLVLLDLMLPGLDGTALCRRIREQSRVPIIMLTAKSAEIDKVVGLEIGADDYITKPFKLGELCSRIRALLRRAGISKSERSSYLECGDVEIDLIESRATLRGKTLDLTSAEYRLLCLLVRGANHVVTRDVIINELWNGTGNYVDPNTLSVYVRRLREKVEADPSRPEHLVTVRGFGYRWNEVSA